MICAAQMDNIVLKIVQIFVFVPHLLLMNMNSAYSASRCRASKRRTQPAASVRAPLLTRLSLLRQGEKVYQLGVYLALELSLSWSKSMQRYSQRSR